MGLRGSVRALSLDQLLEFLSASQHQGSLKISYKDKTCVLCLMGGVVYVDQRGEVSHRLGEILVHRGFLTLERVEEALAAQKDQGGRIGEVLVNLNYITEEQLNAAYRGQLEEEIYDLFILDEAIFEFHRGITDEFKERVRAGLPGFPVRSILMEAARRYDEWRHIKNTIRSHKRIYKVTAEEPGLKRGNKLFKDIEADPSAAFDKTRSIEAMLPRMGMTQFDGLSLIARLISERYLEPIAAREIEQEFRDHLESNVYEAVKYYECALELPECEPRLRRHYERNLFATNEFSSPECTVRFGATAKGRRAFATLLSLYRSRVVCTIFCREGDQEIRFELLGDSVIWRGDVERINQGILEYLLAENVLLAPDVDAARGQPDLHTVLVGAGKIQEEEWEKAKLAAMFREMFSLFFWIQPYMQIETGSAVNREVGANDLHVELKDWVEDKVSSKIKHWERITQHVPSVQSFFVLTTKGQKVVTTALDDLNLFDGRRTLEQVIKLQNRSPEDFFTWLHEQYQGGRVEPLDEENYRQRMDQALNMGRVRDAIAYCKGAISSNLQVSYFTDRLHEIQRKHGEGGKQEAPAILEGDLKSFSLAEILQSFHMSKRSGTLRIFTDDREKEIFFEEGHVFLLEIEDSDNSFLLDDSFIDEVGQGFGSGFVASGLVTVDELEDALAEQIKEEVYDVFLWDGARFEFTRDALPPEFYSNSARVTKYSLNTALFLMEAVRRITNWEQIREIVPSDEIVVSFDSYETKMRAVTERGSQEVLLLVDGRHTLTDILRISGARRFHAVALVADLIQSQQLATVEATSDDDKAKDEERFGPVNGLYFVDTLRELSGGKVTGMLRITDGRRSKELAFVTGQPHRNSPFKKGVGDPATDRSLSTRFYAQDFAEALVLKNANYQFLPGVLPPILEVEESRAGCDLDTDEFFLNVTESGAQWMQADQNVDRDRPLGWMAPDAVDMARQTIATQANVFDWIDGNRNAEEIIRAHPEGRFLSFMSLAELIRSGFVVYVEASEEMSEDEWDFGL